jgi:hypothetical protein
MNSILIVVVLSFISVFIPVSSECATQEFNHPAGLKFQYPDNWAINDSSFADVELVPPDQSQSEQGPTEAYFLWGLGLKDSSSTESQIDIKLHELMGQIAGFLERTGDPESFIGKNSTGLIYTYEGKRPDAIIVRARIFVFPRKEIAFALVALGVREEITKRESTIASIFGTFTSSEAATDRTLIGSWQSIPEKVEQTQTMELQTQPAAPEESSMNLREDGSFSMKSSSTQGEEGETEGRWYGGGGKIYFVSPENVALTFRYELRGETPNRELSLIHPGGDRQEMREVKHNPESH